MSNILSLVLLVTNITFIFVADNKYVAACNAFAAGCVFSLIIRELV